ncbi:MAG: Sir2 family NAD-dependent protein deacetylase [Pseudomonadota bacterium]
MIDVSPDPTSRLTTALSGVGTGYLVVVTGAGISLASGIPTFRGTDPDAVWSRDVMEMGTRQFFMQHPVESWSWYLSRFDHVLDKQPNPAHTALATLERWHRGRGGEFLLVTQNVDPLHERAGSEALVKVHGSADRVRCVETGCANAAPAGSLPRPAEAIETFRSSPSASTLPTCHICGGWLRQHVLWFDEFYDEHRDYQWLRVLDAAARADLLLFVGTSFAVGVTDLFLSAAVKRDVAALSIDPGAADTPHRAVLPLPEKAEELLPAALAKLQSTA